MDEMDLQFAFEDVFDEYAGESIGDEELADQIGVVFAIGAAAGYDDDELWEIAGTAASNANVHAAAGRALGLT